MSATPVFSSSEATTRPIAPPAEFVSGFGTLMAEELELRALLRNAITEIEGRQSLNLFRILRHHDQQISAIIALIEQREDELPEAIRFQAPPSTLALHAQPRSTPAEAAAEMLPQLVAANIRLVQAIEALVKAGGRGADGEPLLKEAAQRHHDMAWMLSALLSEGSN